MKYGQIAQALQALSEPECVLQFLNKIDYQDARELASLLNDEYQVFAEYIVYNKSFGEWLIDEYPEEE